MADSTALADGTYKVVCAANVALTVNCCGATDGNGANVWLYKDDSSDATYVHVWTRPDGTRQLCFAATGKCLDVSGGVVTHGRNVQQWQANDSVAQRWAIPAVDGKTVTVGGTAYQQYRIVVASTLGKETEFVLDANGTGTPASGTNLDICEDESADDQRWCFVPANPVPTGTYVIRPRVAPTLALDVYGSSHSGGARVCISGEHVGTGIDDGRNQVVWVREYDTDGQAKVAFTHSMLLMELAVYKSSAASGARVVQSQDDGGTDQRWVVTPHGTMAANGVVVPCHVVRNVAASGAPLVLDVIGGRTSPGTYVQVWQQNWAPAQDFYFEPVAMPTSELPMPSSVGLTWSPDGAGASDAIAAQDAPSGGGVHVAWTGPGTEWQLRCRTRSRVPGHTAGEWGPWLSVPEGSSANHGWGTEWRPTVTTADGGTHVAALPISDAIPDNSASDWVGVQVEVRRCERDFRGSTGLFACGPSAVVDGGIVWRPTVTLSSVAWTPNGIVLSVSSDYARGGNQLSVESLSVGGEPVTSGTLSFGDLPHDATVTIPVADLTRVPDDGAAVSATVAWSSDHATARQTLSGKVAWDANHGISVSPTYESTDRLTLLVSADAHDSDEAWAVGNGTLVPLDVVSRSGGTVTWEALPPLGGSYDVCVVSKSGTSWGTSIDAMPSMDDSAMVWNWVDGTTRRAAVMRLARGSLPKRDETIRPSSTSLSTTGREHPVFRFGVTSTRTLDASGSVLADESRKWSGTSDFRALAEAHHATYRDPSGLVASVAVTGVTMPREDSGYVDVTVSQEEETL